MSSTATPVSSASEIPKITLHWLEKSCSQRILWLLEELSILYGIEVHKRDPKTNLTLPELKTVHPLGKFPVITVGDHTIAESAVIVEYLSEHFRTALIPSKWKDGCKGKLGGDTEEYLHYRYYMHYCEGSLMSLLMVSLVANSLRAPVPFFICPVTSGISAKIRSGYLEPNLVTHFGLTSADIMMSFPILRPGPAGLAKETHSKLFAYAELLKGSESYKRAVDKIVKLEGKYTLL
ncbi:glutathione S-transferase [Mycena rosella]|uniref:Glutathione S-transferase n=1 Tax=Mycena rosella TaxID=1033263 RepID=A0AAD7H251_MYCRO|nr:glutathione S-transferase [Mycena rosella]